MAQTKLIAGLQVLDVTADIAGPEGNILARKGDRIILMPTTLAQAVQFLDGSSLAEKWLTLASRFRGGGSVSVTRNADGSITISGVNTTYGNMTAATASAAGKAGLVPAPAAGAQAKYLRGDGTWQTPPDTNTTYSAATQSASGLMSAADKKKLDGIAANATATAAPPAAGTATPKAHGTAAAGTSASYAREDHVHPSNNTDTHWTSHLYVGASNGSANAATTNGNTYLMILDNTSVRDRRLIRGAGSVSVASDANGNITITGTNTTYGNMTAATASAAGKAGLVPAPAAGAQAKYLRGDGTWQTPPNTTYAAATQSANGLMSAADKKKLDGIGNPNTFATGPLEIYHATPFIDFHFAKDTADYTARIIESTKGVLALGSNTPAGSNGTQIATAAFVVPKTGARGSLAGHETASALSNSQTITASSPDCINLATSGAVTLTFTAAAATVRAVKVICLTASAATTLTIKNAVWANNGTAPAWGAAGKILVLVAHFAGGRVILSVADNTQ